jgi:hypothetical protein
MDPDFTGQFADEIAAYTRILGEELAKVPHVSQVLFWDDQEGGDPTLDLDASTYDKRELVATPAPAEGVYVGEQVAGAAWSREGSYYGATLYQRKWYPVGQWVISLWFGGSPVNSASGFYVIPVA